jgi:hypothetical protein
MDFELLLEAERRGILPPEQAGLLQEARRRGLVPQAQQAAVQASPERYVAPPAVSPAQTGPAPSVGDRIVGAGETALSLLTGALGGSMGMIQGTGAGLTRAILSGQFGTQQAANEIERAAAEQASRFTYAPRTQAGREMLGAVGETLQQVAPPVLPQIAAPGMAIQAVTQQAPLAAATAGRVAAAAAPAAMAVVQAPARGARAVGRAAGLLPPEPAAPAPGMTMAPGGAVGAQATDAALRRVATAQQMPVPMTLTRGGATRDPSQLAFEKEAMKGPQGAPLRQRAEENNLQALQNMDALIDMTSAQAPDIAATGTAVTKALSSGYQAEKNRVNVLYNKARKSPEAQEVVDTNTLVRIGSGEDQIENSLIGYLNSKVTGVPSSQVPDTARKLMVKLGLAAEDEGGNLVGLPATVGKMEELRKELSGVAKFDDRVGLREETILKRMIDAQTEPVAGPAFREARAARTQMARKYENRAIVARLIQNVRGMDDPKVPADQVFRTSIVNSSPEEITFLRRVLQTSGDDGKQAWNELQGAFARHLRDQATKGLGLDSNDNPLVSPAQLHQAIRQFDANGRLDLMMGKQNAQIVRDLDDLVRYANTVPPGTLINSSGTTGTIIAALLETGAQGFVTGLPLPLVTAVREIAKMRKRTKNEAEMRAKINDALNALPTVPPAAP